MSLAKTKIFLSVWVSCFLLNCGGAKPLYIQQRKKSETQLIFCRSIQQALAHVAPPPMVGFAVNAMSPWVRGKPNAFPATAVTHPVLGKDMATYLPTARSFLELRTFELGRVEYDEAKELCYDYEKFVAWLYDVQRSGFERTKAPDSDYNSNSGELSSSEHAAVLALGDVAYDGKVSSSHILQDESYPYSRLNEEYFKVYSKLEVDEVAKIYGDRNLYFRASTTPGKNATAEFLKTPWGELATRNALWVANITKPLQLLTGDGKMGADEKEFLHFFGSQAWPLDDTHGTTAAEVTARAEKAYKTVLADFETSNEDPNISNRQVQKYWLNLYNEGRQYVISKNPSDTRGARFQSFAKLLAAELTYIHTVTIPSRLSALQDKWKALYEKRRQTLQAMLKEPDEGYEAFAAKKLTEAAQIRDDRALTSIVREKLSARMAALGYSPERQSRILAIFEAKQKELIARFK